MRRGGNDSERERFDAAAVLAGCVQGYASVYPARRFELANATTPVMLSGAPDLFAQMLDKLAANAADFAADGSTVHISLSVDARDAVLCVSNDGPLLPEEMQGRLFESMVSVRSGAQAREPHLGLGLYIVRLIAEFHGGRVTADNRADGRGVEFTLRFPLAA
ncbi:MAG: hypothetical protein EBT83_16530 [Betaproteobacteria bacterium]|nr:hypothetical protein [Betaproteobacteria bacterium]